MSRAGGEKAGRPSVAEATLAVYQGVIDDVVTNVKADFVQEGVDESILEELRTLWESYLVRMGSSGSQQGPPADGAAPREATVPVVKQEREVGAPLEQAEDRKKFLKSEDGQRSSIPQWDGAGEGTEGEASTSAVDKEGSAQEDQDSELNEDDDLGGDDLGSSSDEEEGGDPDIMLGQFDKVHRAKTRWRVNLRHCILHLAGKDYLLHKVTGEFNF